MFRDKGDSEYFVASIDDITIDDHTYHVNRVCVVDHQNDDVMELEGAEVAAFNDIICAVIDSRVQRNECIGRPFVCDAVSIVEDGLYKSCPQHEAQAYRVSVGDKQIGIFKDEDVAVDFTQRLATAVKLNTLDNLFNSHNITNMVNPHKTQPDVYAAAADLYQSFAKRPGL